MCAAARAETDRRGSVPASNSSSHTAWLRDFGFWTPKRHGPSELCPALEAEPLLDDGPNLVEGPLLYGDRQAGEGADRRGQETPRKSALVSVPGFEPGTSALAKGALYQLSYTPPKKTLRSEWRAWLDLNQQPPDTRLRALPVELHARSNHMKIILILLNALSQITFPS